MKKAMPNPTWVPSWDRGISDSFIYESYITYQKFWMHRYSIEGHYYGPHERRYYSEIKYHYTGKSANWMLINFLYREGRTQKVLACDFADFADALITGYSCLTRKYTRYSYLKAPFRHKHEKCDWNKLGKKTLSEKEQARRDWRSDKKIDKDKKKASWSRSNLGPGKWYKRQSNRSHRAWERENISRGNWDDLKNDSSIKYFQDPWMWD